MREIRVPGTAGLPHNRAAQGRGLAGEFRHQTAQLRRHLLNRFHAV
ncbi:hypothetical protein C7S16_5845 [Burkholderia thailandensis]|uniref:Uncharacterized protein n=1 Tax=Burkholderia thailandensis TaxID=57975 RepID=A0AAW9CMW7_BURTH|nr:hypothetical protein [Burkholderia thailandensis]